MTRFNKINKTVRFFFFSSINQNARFTLPCLILGLFWVHRVFVQVVIHLHSLKFEMHLNMWGAIMF